MSQTPPLPPGEKTPDRVYLISHPKIVFMYPTFLAALVMAIFMTIRPEEDGTSHVMNLAFLMLFGVNLVVLSFDFPRTLWITWFAVIAVVVMALVLLFTHKPDLLPVFDNLFDKLEPHASAQFYYIFSTIFGVMFLVVAVAVQFDYWEVRPNELLHHHGVLSDLERFAVPNLKIEKEINDLFEYFLLRSGRLIITSHQERKTIVLENVFFINRKEDQLTRMLSALQVQVRED